MASAQTRVEITIGGSAVAGRNLDRDSETFSSGLSKMEYCRGYDWYPGLSVAGECLTYFAIMFLVAACGWYLYGRQCPAATGGFLALFEVLRGRPTSEVTGWGADLVSCQ